MKLKLLNLSKTEEKTVELPEQFYEPVRLDLIKRAVLAIQSNNRQSYGATPRAGLRASGELSRRRKKYRGSYGLGISRVPRKIMSRRGTRFNWVGAVMPGTVGGRRAHPPKSSKIVEQKINIKERRKAIRSAIAASIKPELATERGHKVPANYPFLITSKLEDVKTTKELKQLLEKFGLEEELERTSERTTSTGRARRRGRKYHTKSGPLLVVSKECAVEKAAANLLGVEVCQVKNLNAEILAPGTVPGRVTIYTDLAIKELTDKKLFTKDFKGEKVEKKTLEVKVKLIPKVKKITKAKSTKPKATTKKAPAKKK